MTEQKGMTFDLDFTIHSHFLLPSFFEGERKGEKNNQMPFCLIKLNLQIK